MPDIIHSTPYDPVGPRRIVTYEIVITDTGPRVFTDSNPYAGDASAKAMQFTHELESAGRTFQWHEVRLVRRIERHTGLVFPMMTREVFSVYSEATYDPLGSEGVPQSARREAIDAFLTKWPMHATPANALVTQDRAVASRVNWNGVVMELICYALIAIVIGSIWRLCAPRSTNRAMQTAEPES